jgi:hypothetical protein
MRGQGGRGQGAHTKIRDVDWNDPGVVAWLVEKGAYVPLEHVRMHLQDLQECQRLSMRPLDADIQGEEDEAHRSDLGYEEDIFTTPIRFGVRRGHFHTSLDSTTRD